MPDFDPGFVAEVDVDDRADAFVEILVLAESIGGGEQHAVIAVLAQQSLHAPEHAGIVVDDVNQFALRHMRWSCSGRRTAPVRLSLKSARSDWFRRTPADQVLMHLRRMWAGSYCPCGQYVEIEPQP